MSFGGFRPWWRRNQRKQNKNKEGFRCEPPWIPTWIYFDCISLIAWIFFTFNFSIFYNNFIYLGLFIIVWVVICCVSFRLLKVIGFFFNLSISLPMYHLISKPLKIIYIFYEWTIHKRKLIEYDFDCLLSLITWIFFYFQFPIFLK